MLNLIKAVLLLGVFLSVTACNIFSGGTDCTYVDIDQILSDPLRYNNTFICTEGVLIANEGIRLFRNYPPESYNRGYIDIDDLRAVAFIKKYGNNSHVRVEGKIALNSRCWNLEEAPDGEVYECLPKKPIDINVRTILPI